MTFELVYKLKSRENISSMTVRVNTSGFIFSSDIVRDYLKTDFVDVHVDYQNKKIGFTPGLAASWKMDKLNRNICMSCQMAVGKGNYPAKLVGKMLVIDVPSLIKIKA